MKNLCCENCKYYSVNADLQIQGECRYNPPTAFSATMNGIPTIIGAFPGIKGNAWCRMHEAKEDQDEAMSRVRKL